MQLTALSLALTRIGLRGLDAYSPALNLDLTSGNQTLDPRITFSRASNATVTGPDGVLRYAPHNLLTYSEQFDNATVVKVGLNVAANTEVAPDGLMTADVVSRAADGLVSRNIRFNVTTTQTGTYTFSHYVKPVGSTTRIALRLQDNLAAGGHCVFDLVAAGSIFSTSNATGFIEKIGNYYRCSVTVALTGTFTSIQCLSFLGAYGNSTDPTPFAFWGAQLNVGSLQPYYPTTVKNLLGFTQEFDNAAWTKSNSFVQTNLLTWSEQFDNPAWGRTGVTVTENAAVAPDGTLTADLLAATLADCTIGRYSVAATAGTLHTASVWLRAGTPTTLSIFLIDSGGGSGNTQAVCNVTTSWQRFTVARTASTGTTTIGFQVGGGSTFSAGEAVYIWGAQLVQGSTPGGYQRTESTARAVMYPAPDGSMTADKLVEDTATGFHYARPATSVTVVSGTVITTSVYAKAGERSKLGIYPYNSSAGASFDLTTGTVISSGGLSVSMVSMGSGWYRCAASIVAPAASATPWILVLNNAGATSYTGDGTSGIYIWGAQLSDSASLDPYVYNPGAAPTAAAYYGPRFDYDPVTLQPKGLLIEEQRTNSIRNNTMQGSVAGTPGTLPTNWSVTAPSGISISVAGTGVDAGLNYIDIAAAGTATAGGQLFVSPESITNTVASSGQSWAAAWFFSVVSGSVSSGGLSSQRIDITGRDAAGSTLETTSQAYTPTNAALQTQRPQVTRALANAGSVRVHSAFRIDIANGAVVSFTLRIGMPQLELGAFATSVIPTTTAAATRAADVAVMTGANFSNWYNQSEGTLFVSADCFSPGTTITHAISDNTFNNSIYGSFSGGNTYRGANVLVGGVSQAGAISTFTGVSASAGIADALSYKANDFAESLGGQSARTDTTGTAPNVDRMYLGANWSGAGNFLNGHIRRIAYFPRRLTNAELQGVTA